MKEPSTILQDKILLIEMAGNIEYLEEEAQHSRKATGEINDHIPSSSYKEHHSVCSAPRKGPSLTMECCASIEVALVKKHKLLGCVVEANMV